MTFSAIKIVQTRQEFDAAMDCQWEGFTEPLESFWKLWFPLDLEKHVGGTLSRDDAIVESRDRMWSEHISDPSSTWIYIAEETRGTPQGVPRVVACCQWRVYEAPTNPFPDGLPDIQCVAWPEGSEGARFSARVARNFFTPRVSWMSRPHVGLSWMAVRPGMRHKGLGSSLMQWGTNHADSLGLEMFIEGSDLGKLLYQRHGFRVLRELHLDLAPHELSNRKGWDALIKYYLPEGMHFHAMWRPIGGEWVNWEEEWRQRFGVWDALRESNGRYSLTVA